MDIPEYLWRFPTRAAIDSLAHRFDLPNTPDMQDWEYEVADPERINEFLDAYESGVLSDDERFTLMETIIQSFEEFKHSPTSHPKWARVLEILDTHIDLHIYTICYWSDLDCNNLDNSWRVTPYIRSILEKHPRHYRDVHSG